MFTAEHVDSWSTWSLQECLEKQGFWCGNLPFFFFFLPFWGTHFFSFNPTHALSNFLGFLGRRGGGGWGGGGGTPVLGESIVKPVVLGVLVWGGGCTWLIPSASVPRFQGIQYSYYSVSSALSPHYRGQFMLQ